MRKIYNIMMAYMPSLLSRYSTQILVIAIPLFMQKNGGMIDEISKSLIFFYVGTMVFGIVGLKIKTKENIQKILAISLLIQALAGVLCFVVPNIIWVAFFRFIQGAATAWSRPLAQIWANEFLNNFSKTDSEKVLINTFVQLAIGLGMALGSFVGIWIGQEKIGLVIQVFFILTPAIFFALVMSRTNAMEDIDNSSFDKEYELSPKIGNLLKEKEYLALVFLIFLLSMAFYNVWPIIFPFEARRRWDPIPVEFTFALVIQPIVFSLCQLAIAVTIKNTSISMKTIFNVLLGSHIGALFFGIFCLQSTSKTLYITYFILSTGVFVSAIYPLSMFIIVGSISKSSQNLQKILQRKLLFYFGLIGDFGQLLGGLILTFSWFSDNPILAIIFLIFSTFFLKIISYYAIRLKI